MGKAGYPSILILMSLHSTRGIRRGNRVLCSWNLIVALKETHCDEEETMVLKGGSVAPEKEVRDIKMLWELGPHKASFLHRKKVKTKFQISGPWWQGMSTVYKRTRGVTQSGLKGYWTGGDSWRLWGCSAVKSIYWSSWRCKFGSQLQHLAVHRYLQLHLQGI